MKKWILETLGKAAKKEIENSFSEVSANHWYQPDLDKDLKRQIMEQK